jgi:DNA processing protein
VLLYLKGNRQLLKATSVAVVGSRNATPGGIQNAEAFSRALSDGGLTVVSGLAMGIDAAAHRGGLAGKSSTIAVVGTGLDLVYPARNKPLAQQIAQQGLIVSEFALGTPALAANFPRRNRIISGLSRGVLVVEAALASGSLITARQAADQGREVFALPGSIHSPFSKGSHQLIKQGAKLVDDANDIFIELGWIIRHPAANTEAGDATLVDSPLLHALGFDAASVDELSLRTSLPASALIAQLTELELNGAVARLPGGKYQRLAPA